MTNLAIQVILNCATHMGGSCYGGNPNGVYAWVHLNGVPEDTCQQYKAIDDYCEPLNICRNCVPPPGEKRNCSPVQNYTRHWVEEYGQVSGEEAMMEELTRGPIACVIDAVPVDNYTSGIVDEDVNQWHPDTGKWVHNHIISVAGYGTTDDGVDYWIVRNSWGTYWGERGWFRVVRGKNMIAIESLCSWATPGEETWSGADVPDHDDSPVMASLDS